MTALSYPMPGTDGDPATIQLALTFCREELIRRTRHESYPFQFELRVDGRLRPAHFDEYEFTKVLFGPNEEDKDREATLVNNGRFEAPIWRYTWDSIRPELEEMCKRLKAEVTPVLKPVRVDF